MARPVRSSFSLRKRSRTRVQLSHPWFPLGPSLLACQPQFQVEPLRTLLLRVDVSQRTLFRKFAPGIFLTIRKSEPNSPWSLAPRKGHVLPLDVTGPAFDESQGCDLKRAAPVSPQGAALVVPLLLLTVCVSVCVCQLPYFLIIALSRRGTSGHKTEPLVENPGEQHK